MPLGGQSPIHVQPRVIRISSADLMPFFSLSVAVMPAFLQFFIRSSDGSHLASAWSTHFLLTWAPSVILLELNINVTLSKMPFLNFQPEFGPSNHILYFFFISVGSCILICVCFMSSFLTRPSALWRQWLPIVPGTECVLCMCCWMGEGVFIEWKPGTADSTVSRGPNLRDQLKHTYTRTLLWEDLWEVRVYKISNLEGNWYKNRF